MISPDEVRRKAERWWLDVLRAWLDGTIDDFFPKDIPQIGLDKGADRLARFATIRQEQEALHQQSKAVQGFGYSLEWKTKGSRLVGQNDYITRIYIESLDDFLRLVGKEVDYNEFVQDAERVRTTSPALISLFKRNPQLVIDQSGNWPDLLKVTAYFEQNPRPLQYVRSLPLDLPTKFIENNKAVLRVLLDHLIPDHLNADETDFYKRFHLNVEEPLVKIRFLDESLRLHPSLSHISVWLSEFHELRLGGSRVFIIENLTTFLTFPNLPDSVAIWGGGFAVTLLGGIDWLADKQLYYWGDIDVHGFQILSLIREKYPAIQSLLMDAATFRKFYQGKHGKSFNALALTNLTDEESHLYDMLLIENWRLEQERVTEEWVEQVLGEL
ncbi:DUF3322 and DUF2220 domain-containing protein [soil metagenome]